MYKNITKSMFQEKQIQKNNASTGTSYLDKYPQMNHSQFFVQVYTYFPHVVPLHVMSKWRH